MKCKECKMDLVEFNKSDGSKVWKCPKCGKTIVSTQESTLTHRPFANLVLQTKSTCHASD